jgi:hypothetical protein
MLARAVCVSRRCEAAYIGDDIACVYNSQLSLYLESVTGNRATAAGPRPRAVCENGKEVNSC